MGCGSSKISTGDVLALGAIQIMIGTFHVFLWYFILILYMGQIKGVFGTYEPITYKTGSALWGIFFILAGALTIRSVRHPSRTVFICTLAMNILCMILAIAAAILTVVELCTFKSVSYRNYGQAKLGREVSRILLVSYPLEFAIALTYSICICSSLDQRREDNPTQTEEVESTY
ncbi:membrane-spanning 4-domains subfamily A member 13 [Castor canadensis]|uniref:Membrane-spanning 4-domains subfamily A member 13 n=1 Tax=Castor canadensis TaxID=51338 RepID=A0AC58LSA0_CASCN